MKKDEPFILPSAESNEQVIHLIRPSAITHIRLEIQGMDVPMLNQNN